MHKVSLRKIHQSLFWGILLSSLGTIVHADTAIPTDMVNYCTSNRYKENYCYYGNQSVYRVQLTHKIFDSYEELVGDHGECQKYLFQESMQGPPSPREAEDQKTMAQLEEVARLNYVQFQWVKSQQWTVELDYRRHYEDVLNEESHFWNPKKGEIDLQEYMKNLGDIQSKGFIQRVHSSLQPLAQKKFEEYLLSLFPSQKSSADSFLAVADKEVMFGEVYVPELLQKSDLVLVPQYGWIMTHAETDQQAQERWKKFQDFMVALRDDPRSNSKDHLKKNYFRRVFLRLEETLSLMRYQQKESQFMDSIKKEVCLGIENRDWFITNGILSYQKQLKSEETLSDKLIQWLTKPRKK